MGKAKNLKKRVGSYFKTTQLEGKTIRLVNDAVSIDTIVVASEIEAFLLESNLIKKYRPQYNVLFKDDKSYTSLEIGRKPIPYVVLTRKRTNPPAGGAVYFGPFTSSSDLKIVLKILRRIFPFQSVKNHPPRRCLYYHIGLCPCIPAFPDRLFEYKKDIKKITNFLKGDVGSVVSELKSEQKEFVASEEFEKAGEIQKKIEKINYITSKNYDPFNYEEKPDFYFERIKGEVDSLREILTKYGLPISELNRIECYDISNISGKNATGSMVVFTDGDTNKNEYRRFKIKFKKTPDDFEMMREVLRRRIKRTDWEMPNLMVIDGGRGQVSAVLQVFTETNFKVPVIGLAKREETIIIPIRIASGVDFIEVKLPNSTPGINLLRRIRDEAHRFAITYHRLLRKKALRI